MSKKYNVKQYKSVCGQTKRTKATLQTLGLGRVGKSSVLSAEDPCIIGKLKKVQHLVHITEEK